MDADSAIFRKLYVDIMAVCNTKSHSDVLLSSSRGRSRNFKRGVHRAEFSSKGGGGGNHILGVICIGINKFFSKGGGGGGGGPPGHPPGSAPEFYTLIAFATTITRSFSWSLATSRLLRLIP